MWRLRAWRETLRYTWIVMVQQVEAIYEKGMLRPLQPLRLKELEKVHLAVSPSVPSSLEEMTDQTLLEYARTRIASLERSPTMEETREKLSAIKGSMAETIVSERGDY